MGGGPDHKLHGPDYYSTINQFLGWEVGPDHTLHSLQLSEMEIRDRPHPPINYYPHAHEYN